MSEQAAGDYRGYWIAWLILLALTIVMVGTHNRSILLVGIAIKAAVISLWFMHLKYERPLFAVTLTVAVLATALVLFGLIYFDAQVVA